MTKAYIKLDPGFPDRKDYYPDGAFRALVTLFCSAAHQPKPGTFRSERIVRALLGKHAKWLPFLIEERDVDVTRDGGYHVVGWEVWQEGKFPSVEARMAAIESRRGAMTPAERAFLYRQRKRDEPRDASRDAERDGPSDTSTSTSLHETSTAEPPRPPTVLKDLTKKKPDDEQLLADRLAEYRDPSTPPWKKDVLRSWLHDLGVHDPDAVAA